MALVVGLLFILPHNPLVIVAMAQVRSMLVLKMGYSPTHSAIQRPFLSQFTEATQNTPLMQEEGIFIDSIINFQSSQVYYLFGTYAVNSLSFWML